MTKGPEQQQIGGKIYHGKLYQQKCGNKSCCFVWQDRLTVAGVVNHQKKKEDEEEEKYKMVLYPGALNNPAA